MRRFWVGALFLLFAVGAQADTDALFNAVLTDVQGKRLPLAYFRGKPLIVNFWARWCAPCREEFPELNALQTQHGQNLVVLGIALDSDPAKVREFAAAYGMKYPVALADEGKGIALMEALGNAITALPFTLLVNRQGDILVRKHGVFRKSDLLPEALLP